MLYFLLGVSVWFVSGLLLVDDLLGLRLCIGCGVVCVLLITAVFWFCDLYCAGWVPYILVFMLLGDCLCGF